MGAWKKPATESETIFMEKLHKIIVSVTGIPREEYCSDRNLARYVRCRQIFAYNCRIRGIQNIVMNQSINKSHSAMSTYADHYTRDYKTDYKGFQRYADKVTEKLLASTRSHKNMATVDLNNNCYQDKC